MAAQAGLSPHLSKCHIVGNHMSMKIVYILENSVDTDEMQHSPGSLLFAEVLIYKSPVYKGVKCQ